MPNIIHNTSPLHPSYPCTLKDSSGKTFGSVLEYYLHRKESLFKKKKSIREDSLVHKIPYGEEDWLIVHKDALRRGYEMLVLQNEAAQKKLLSHTVFIFEENSPLKQPIEEILPQLYLQVSLSKQYPVEDSLLVLFQNKALGTLRLKPGVHEFPWYSAMFTFYGAEPEIEEKYALWIVWRETEEENEEVEENYMISGEYLTEMAHDGTDILKELQNYPGEIPDEYLPFFDVRNWMIITASGYWCPLMFEKMMSMGSDFNTGWRMSDAAFDNYFHEVPDYFSLD